MEMPAVKEVPEVLDIIAKYNILSKFGSAYTFESLDNEPYENIQLMLLCMNYENKAVETQSNRERFYQGDFNEC